MKALAREKAGDLRKRRDSDSHEAVATRFHARSAVNNSLTQHDLSCPCGGGCPRCVQAKLSVGRPGDPCEREADEIADTVMRMPATGIPKVENERKSRMLLKADPSFSRSLTITDNPIKGLGPGQPLDAETKAYMESSMGYDFYGVRVHTGNEAAESAGKMDALAYTVGRDVVFGPGRYQPRTAEGRRLLAHELTHVIQQSQGVIPASRDPAGRWPIPVVSSGMVDLARKEARPSRPPGQQVKDFPEPWRPKAAHEVMKYSEAKWILDVVKNDPECKKRLDSKAGVLPAPWAGWARDAAVMGPDMFTGKEPTPEKSKMVCTGIADAAVKAIENAHIPFVEKVSWAERPGGYFTEAGMITGNHTAVTVTLASHQSVVFDWWATMDINDPLIFPSLEDFKRADREMRFSAWPGVEAPKEK